MLDGISANPYWILSGIVLFLFAFKFAISGFRENNGQMIQDETTNDDYKDAMNEPYFQHSASCQKSNRHMIQRKTV